MFGFGTGPSSGHELPMTVRGGGVPCSLTVSMPQPRLGPPPRSFAVDAHGCIMGSDLRGPPDTRLWRDASARKRRLRLGLSTKERGSPQGGSESPLTRPPTGPPKKLKVRNSSLTSKAPYKDLLHLPSDRTFTTPAGRITMIMTRRVETGSRQPASGHVPVVQVRVMGVLVSERRVVMQVAMRLARRIVRPVRMLLGQHRMLVVVLPTLCDLRPTS